MKLTRLWRGWRTREAQLDEELQSHLRMAVRERVERGEDPRAAEIAARREFGNLALIEDVTRDHWPLFSLERLARELRHAVRGLRRDSGFAAAAVLTLGLGLAAAVVMFSVVDTVLWRPLPFRDAGRIVTVSEIIPFFGAEPQVVTLREFERWRAAGVFAYCAAVDTASFTLLGAGLPERVDGVQLTADFFRVFGVAPALGRVFRPGEDKRGVPAVAILSHQLWARKFQSDPGIIGRSIRLGDGLRTVVGVMPPGFEFPRHADVGALMSWAPMETEVWIPLQFTEEQVRQGNFNYLVVARMASGLSPAQAQPRLQAITHQIYADEARENSEFGELIKRSLPGIVVLPEALQSTITGGIRPALWMLFGAVALLLVLIYANLGGLFLTRSASRMRDVAVRQALGASAWHIFEERFVESAAIGLLAAALGLLLAVWGTAAIRILGANRLPRLYELTLNYRALLFLSGLSVGAAFLFGMVPWSLQRHFPFTAGARHMAGSRAESRLRAWLVTAEIALSLVLLVGAALLLESFRQVLHADPGFDTRNLLTATIGLPWQPYPDTPRRYRQFERLLDAIRQQPGVEAASLVNGAPLTGEAEIRTLRPGAAAGQAAAAFHAEFRRVDPEYLRTMRIPLVRGRWFSPADGETVAAVSERLGQRLWPGQDPIGRQFREGDNPPLTVIGVVGEVRNATLEIEPTLQYYRPAAADVDGTMAFVIRTRVAPESVISEVRRAVLAVDREQPLAHVRTMREIVSGTTLPRRFETWLLTSFAAVALFLAVMGVFGVLSLSVSRRAREFGIRIALGSSERGILRLVMREAARMIGAGVAAGVVLALLSRRFLSGLLFGVTAGNPAVYAVTIAVLTGAGALACWIPAARAAHADPAMVLREE
ncbi:MAG TPA: ABC transporter permease [Bryobacteraceae bacterium]|jgi:putative ABC transport system permease protein|nr:ABC transporter permease [Bryobacteraceae bacterium]